jgi:hypothetical protein
MPYGRPKPPPKPTDAPTEGFVPEMLTTSAPSVPIAHPNVEKEREKEVDPSKDGWNVLELYCLDVSGSMWKSNNTLKWFGKNRYTAAKELILRFLPSSLFL